MHGFVGTRPPSLIEFYVPPHKRAWWRASGGRVFRNATPDEMATAQRVPESSQCIALDTLLERAQQASLPAAAPINDEPVQLAPDSVEAVQARLAKGDSLRTIAADLGVAPSTLSRRLKKAGA